MPFLGVCLGMQMAAIEISRNKLGMPQANSSEFKEDTPHPIIIEMPEFNPVTKGGTMRLGSRKTVFMNKASSVLWKLYGKPDAIDERHRHRYEVSLVILFSNTDALYNSFKIYAFEFAILLIWH